MKKIGIIPSLFLSFIFIFSCAPSEPDVFEGVWVEKRNPESTWEITKKGNSYIGKRLTGTDKYEYDEETWVRGKEGKFQDPNKSISVLTPSKEGGSKVTYMQQQDMILRLPPGTTYYRKK